MPSIRTLSFKVLPLLAILFLPAQDIYARGGKGASGGSGGGSKTSGKNGKSKNSNSRTGQAKNAGDYLLQLQLRDFEDGKADFLYDAREESTNDSRDKDRLMALRAMVDNQARDIRW